MKRSRARIPLNPPLDARATRRVGELLEREHPPEEEAEYRRWHSELARLMWCYDQLPRARRDEFKKRA